MAGSMIGQSVSRSVNSVSKTEASPSFHCSQLFLPLAVSSMADALPAFLQLPVSVELKSPRAVAIGRSARGIRIDEGWSGIAAVL